MRYCNTRCSLNFSTSSTVAEGGAILSAAPFIIIPEDGQGARKEKSYMFAGGDTDIKPVISGLRINNCIPIHAP